ncbi:MAG: hypothetical protein D6788_10155, partial [Planctomycetota bacterium]
KITLSLDEIAEVRFRPVRDVLPAEFGWVPPETPKEKPSAQASQDATGPERPAEPRPETTDAVPALFHLADGGRLFGVLLPADESRDALITRTVLGDAVAIPFEALAGVQLVRHPRLARAAELFEEALLSPLPGKDVLITRHLDKPKSLRGRLVSLGSAGGRFHFARKTRPVRTERIYGVVFAGAPPGTEADHPVTILLADGSRFSGRLLGDDGGGLRVLASAGATVTIPHERLAALRVRSPRVVYVSDLTPTATHVEGLLHRPWPVRFDRNVAGGPLMLDGVVYPKGIGVHSKTTLVYTLGQRYETLAGTIGLDDSVRPRGHVVFRVEGDGKVLYESGPISGRDEARKIVVPVAGVRELRLIVEYGEAADLSDHADWGGLRLIKPPPVVDPGAS